MLEMHRNEDDSWPQLKTENDEHKAENQNTEMTNYCITNIVLTYSDDNDN